MIEYILHRIKNTKFIFSNPKNNKLVVTYTPNKEYEDMVIYNIPRTNIGNCNQELYITLSIILKLLFRPKNWVKKR